MPDHVFQTNFTSGELSEKLDARIDWDKHKNGARILQNFVAQAFGGAARRAGTIFINEAKLLGKKVRVERFEFNTAQAYTIELGDKYARFYKDRLLLREATASPAYNITLSATSGAGITITFASATLVDTERDKYRIITTLGGGVFLITAVGGTTSCTADTLSPAGGTVYTSGNWTITGKPVEVVTPYLEADLFDLRLTQSADVLFITHGDYPPAKIQRLSTTSFEYVVSAFSPPASVEQAVQPVANLHLAAVSGNAVAFTADADSWMAADVGRQISAQGGRGSIVSFTTAQAVGVDILATFPTTDFATGLWEIDGSPATTMTPSAKAPAGKMITMTLGASGFRTSDQGGFLVIDSGGLIEIKTVTGGTTATGQIMVDIKLDGAFPSGAWTIERPSWSAGLGYPNAVGLKDERLVYAGTDFQPGTFWGSAIGDYENFGRGVRDSDSYSFDIAEGGLDQVRWLKSGLSNLLMGTMWGEYRIRGSGLKSAITPSSIDVEGQGNYGTHFTPDALKTAAGNVIFVQRGGTRVYEISFEESADRMAQTDLSLLSEHLFRSGVRQMTYLRTPTSMLICVMSSGILATATYEKREQVLAWTRQVTLGSFESACVIPNRCGTGEELWVSVKRTIDGQARRMIEVFDGRVTTDCSLEYVGGTAVTTVLGLRHLEGMAVAMKYGTTTPTVATGTVGSGQLTVASNTDILVGLAFTPVIETVRPEFPTKEGPASTRRKKWNNLVLRLYNTTGRPVLNGETMSIPQGSTSILGYTGDLRKSEMGWGREGRLTISHPYPLPITVLGVEGAIQADDG